MRERIGRASRKGGKATYLDFNYNEIFKTEV
jgi:hypothetical protein